MNKLKPDFIKSMQIGNVKLENNLALAPMAGTTDLTFRQICRRMGAGLTVTELVSARGIVYDPGLTRTYRYLEISPDEYPVAIQLFGSDPADFKTAVKTILSHPVLGSCAMIDINMGCPVPKVVRQGAGSALMRTPELAAAVTAACVEAAMPYGKPVTVKIRAGWDDDSKNCDQIARVCEQAGAAAITVHARTRNQMYSGQADWSQISRVRQAVTIPIYGNGDVDSPEKAGQMLEQTGADGVMIGRAAQGNPWIFAAVDPGYADGSTASVDDMPPKDIRFNCMVRHLDGLINRLGEATAVKEMRTHASHYLRNSHNAANYRRQIMSAQSREQFLEVLEEWRID